MTKAQQLREALKNKSILKIMGAHNALGAKLVERHQFDGIWASGLEIATSHGVPDANILTMTENLEIAIQMNDATSLPIICDCDTGYGNSSNVMHMIKKYEAAGIAAVVIEDKHFPKMNSFIPGRQELATIEEFAGKLEAAKSARSSEDGIVIIARIEALIAGWGMEEALKRAEAYYAAGADGLVIHSKSPNPDEVYTFAKLWQERHGDACPLVAIPTTYNDVTAEELAKNGFNIVIYANHGIRTIVKSMNETFAKVQEQGSTQGVENEIATMKEIFQLQGMPTYQENEKLYTRKGEKVVAVIPAAADHQFQPELASLLKDKPLCMLEIAGKPLIEHQLDVLRSVNIRDFRIVTGYEEGKVSADGLEKVNNTEYKERGSAHSLMCGLTDSKEKTLVSYSDIIFDRQIPEALLKSSHPITIVIDRAFESLPRRDKVLDVVSLSKDVSEKKDVRQINLEQFKPIQKIGKKLPAKAVEHEFIGMFLLSSEGLKTLSELWEKVLAKDTSKSFYEAASPLKASVTDLLQFAIDEGAPIYGLEIERGWSEIYSFSDYERVNSYISGSNPQATKV